MKLCNRSGATVRTALKYLANTIPLGSHEGTLIHYPVEVLEAVLQILQAQREVRRSAP